MSLQIEQDQKRLIKAVHEEVMSGTALSLLPLSVLLMSLLQPWGPRAWLSRSRTPRPESLLRSFLLVALRTASVPAVHVRRHVGEGGGLNSFPVHLGAFLLSLDVEKLVEEALLPLLLLLLLHLQLLPPVLKLRDQPILHTMLVPTARRQQRTASPSPTWHLREAASRLPRRPDPLCSPPAMTSHALLLPANLRSVLLLLQRVHNLLRLCDLRLQLRQLCQNLKQESWCQAKLEEKVNLILLCDLPAQLLLLAATNLGKRRTASKTHLSSMRSFSSRLLSASSIPCFTSSAWACSPRWRVCQALQQGTRTRDPPASCSRTPPSPSLAAPSPAQSLRAP
eukprot:768432-Hanusia_phi.AAC.8